LSDPERLGIVGPFYLFPKVFVTYNFPDIYYIIVCLLLRGLWCRVFARPALLTYIYDYLYNGA